MTTLRDEENVSYMYTLPETWTDSMRAALVWLSFMLTLPAIGFFGEIR